MRDIPLGVQTTPSGNRCIATLRMRPAAKVTVSFTWERPPSADDREEWSFTILPSAVHGALEEAFRHRAAIEVLRKHIAAGTLERIGISPAGDWIFCGKSPSAPPMPAGVISLFGKRRDARLRTNRKQHRLRGEGPES
jgi:hypothetical protein